MFEKSDTLIRVVDAIGADEPGVALEDLIDVVCMKLCLIFVVIMQTIRTEFEQLLELFCCGFVLGARRVLLLSTLVIASETPIGLDSLTCRVFFSGLHRNHNLKNLVKCVSFTD